MSIDIPYLKVPRQGEPALDLQRLQQIAAAAGHGHGHLGVFNRPKPWFSLEDNVRPSYDLHFIQTFNPDVAQYLVDRLMACEEALVEAGIAIPDPDEARRARNQREREQREAVAEMARRQREQLQA